MPEPDPQPEGSQATELYKVHEDATKTGGAFLTLESDISDSSEARLFGGDTDESQHDAPDYRVYKRRFFGLIQLVLLNIVISWDWLAFAAISSTASEYYGVSQAAINWLSTGFLFAFVVSAPVSIWVLNRYGTKWSIIVASVLILAGSWIRYAGSHPTHGTFAPALVGQLIIGLAQPFVLAAPTSYSNTWFSDVGRVSATALASLANPFGGAIGELVSPFWVTQVSDMQSMVKYLAVISTVAAIPALFVPNSPPTPPSAIAAAPRLDLFRGLRELPLNGNFWLIMIPFAIYVAGFNATSSLTNQLLEPWGYSETEAGIAGGILIGAGLVAAAVVSPIIDRTKAYVLAVRMLVPAIAITYIILIFMPQCGSIIGSYVTLGLLGATSFSLLPCALELLSITTHPVSPEVSSNIAWAGGQLVGAIFIIVMTALEAPASGWRGQPAGSMTPALIFQACFAVVVVPCAVLIGRGRFGKIQIPSG